MTNITNIDRTPYVKPDDPCDEISAPFWQEPAPTPAAENDHYVFVMAGPPPVPRTGPLTLVAITLSWIVLGLAVGAALVL